MGSKKWIGGVLGWIIYGPIGALVGFIFGAVYDGIDKINESESNPRNGKGGQYSRSGSYQQGGQYSRSGSSRKEWQTGQRNSFLSSMLVLFAAVIKADGKMTDRELEYTKNFVRANFSPQAAEETESVLRQLMGKNIDLYQVCLQIQTYMNYSQRLQLFHYLAALAQCDGVNQAELDILNVIASYTGLSRADDDAILSMFRQDTDSAYKVLEIESTATDEEIRKAYKRMALKYHPDKVATLGEDVQKAAEEKFKRVQEAYEKIKKERGM